MNPTLLALKEQATTRHPASNIELHFDLDKFAELVWQEAYRKGIDDGWTDAMDNKGY